MQAIVTLYDQSATLYSGGLEKRTTRTERFDSGSSQTNIILGLVLGGRSAEDDIKVSPRLTDPAPADAVPAAGLSIAPYLEGWVRDYYQTLGWERKTGKPLHSTLKRLGMEEYIGVL